MRTLAAGNDYQPTRACPGWFSHPGVPMLSRDADQVASLPHHELQHASPPAACRSVLSAYLCQMSAPKKSRGEQMGRDILKVLLLSKSRRQLVW